MTRPSNLSRLIQPCLEHTCGRDDSLLTIHGIHGGFGIGLIGVSNEAEPTTAEGVSILDDGLEQVGI